MATSFASLQQSRTFFHTQPSPALAQIALRPPASPAGGPLIYIVASESVSPAAQDSLDQGRKYLMALMGVANAYVRKQAEENANPDLIGDLALWQQIFNNLPLMGSSQFEVGTYSHDNEGAWIGSEFIEVILGFSVEAGPALDEFGTFLSGIGDSLRFGVAAAKSYNCAIIGGVLRTEDVQPDKVEAYLQGYWIDFTASQENMGLDYKCIKSQFNARALDNPAMKQQFDTFLEEAQSADIKQSKNFFEGSFPPARRLAS